ncbi:MAG: hypothetical protein AAF799_15140 [Myxococcota bacterium]
MSRPDVPVRPRLRPAASSRRRFLAAAAVTLLTLGCNTSTSTTPCDDGYTKEHRAELDAICDLTKDVPWHPVASVPRGVKTTAPTDAVAVGLEPLRLTTSSDGRRWDLPFELEDAWSKALGSDNRRWSLSIAPQTPASDVAMVLESLAARGARSGELVFLAPYEEAPLAPRNPALYKKLRELTETLVSLDTEPEVSAAAHKTLDDTLAFSKECRAIHDAHMAMVRGPVTTRCTTYAEAMAKALRECGCPSWVDDQMTVAYWTFLDNPPAGTSVAVSVTLEDGGTKPAPESTWADVAKTLRSGTVGPFGLKPD